MATLETTHSRSASARPLFVAGCPRSGTTGFTDYLNRHPEVLVCRERYKYVAPKQIAPELFSFERILDFRPGETNLSRDAHVKLLADKDPARLKWVGDKYPHYVKRFGVLAANNPGARFIVLYRPVGEVAESFEARASNPSDRWPLENGFEAGIDLWNESLRLTRKFIEGRSDAEVLIVDYHRFFYKPETLIPLLSGFLELEFDSRIRESWSMMSSRFGARRRPKNTLTSEQESLVEQKKDHAIESWVLDYISRQGTEGSTSRGSVWRRWREAMGQRHRVGRER